MSGLCLEDLSPSRSGEKNTFTSSSLHAYLQYIWHVELQANYQRWKGQLSEALCFSTALVSIHKNVAILSAFMFMHDCALAKIFFAWREKLAVQVSVNRLLAVLCGRTGGSRWTQKECWAKLNVLPVHLNHIKPIIFRHPLSLYLFFISVTSGERLEIDLPVIVKYRSLFRITVFNVRIMWSGRLWKSIG